LVDSAAAPGFLWGRMSGGKTNEIRGGAKMTVLGWLAGWIMRLIGMTLRVTLVDRCGLSRPGELPGAAIYALWHNRVFAVAPIWRRFCGHRRAVALTSASRDGAALTAAVGVLGIGTVRGSSSRRGAAALVALRRALLAGSDVCLTPDGPRGPRYELQGGIIKLAQATGAPIVAMHIRFGRAWRLKSWDRMVIPVPFSRVEVVFDEALAVPAELGEDGFEDLRRRLEEDLRGATDDHHLPAFPRRKNS
jgi:lysophospholipid acyltransferase (LPLAT)-like uncharacterized protein